MSRKRTPNLGETSSDPGYATRDTPSSGAASAGCQPLIAQIPSQTGLAESIQLHSVIAFDTVLTHRLRQPLTAITYLCGIIRNIVRNDGDSPLRAELEPFLDKIGAQASRATEILGEFREQTRVAAQPTGKFSVANVLNDVTTALQSLAAEHAVTLEWQADDGLTEVPGDSALIQQGLINLIRNAIEALATSPAGDHYVKVTANRTPDGVLISVIDNGQGVDQARRERIFELFDTTKPGRLGLGLGISRSIARAHDGRLWQEDNPDGGAIFRLVLPLAEDHR